jgi:hypothetical protein
MPETRFDGPPINGIQVALTSSGSEITPYRVTVTENGQLVRQLQFTSKADAQRVHDEKWKAAHNAKRT